METVFLKKVKVAADAYSFYFKRPAGFNFAPGQYLRMEIEIQNPDVRGASRLFTIAASPTEEDLMITTRVIQSSFKKTLEQMKSGTQVKIFGPYGTFVLKEEEKQRHVFLAGGIGITPLRSMIKYALDKNLTIPITLFTSFRTPDDIVFSEMLREIETDWFKLIETVTRPEESETPWSGLTGRIDAELIKKNVSDLNSSLFYISGPAAMVDALTEVVQTLNVSKEQIRIEKFTGY